MKKITMKVCRLLCLISTLVTYQASAAPGGKRLFIAYDKDGIEEERVFPDKGRARSGRSADDSSEEIIIEGTIKGTLLNAEDKETMIQVNGMGTGLNGQRPGVNAQGQPFNHQGQNNLQGSTIGAHFGQQDSFTNGGSMTDTSYASGSGHKIINTVGETYPSGQVHFNKEHMGEYYMSEPHQLPVGRPHLNNDKQTEQSRQVFFTQSISGSRSSQESLESGHIVSPHHVNSIKNTQPNPQVLFENRLNRGPQIDQQSHLSKEMHLNEYFKGSTPSIGIGYISEHQKILAQPGPSNSNNQVNFRKESQSIERGHTAGQPQELSKAVLNFHMPNCQGDGNNIADICKLCSTGNLYDHLYNKANCGKANYGLTGAGIDGKSSIAGGAGIEGGPSVAGEATITGETGFVKGASVAGGAGIAEEVSVGEGAGIGGRRGIGEGISFGNRFGIVSAFGGLSNRLGKRLKGIGGMLPKFSRSRSSFDSNLPMEYQKYPIGKSYFNNVIRAHPNQQIFFRNIPMAKIQAIDTSYNIEPNKNILTKEPYINTINDVVPNRQTFYKNRLTRDSHTGRQGLFINNIQGRRDFNDETHLIETDHNILEQHQIMSKEGPYYNIPNCRDIENGVVGICSLCSYGGLYYHLNNNINCGATNYVSNGADSDSGAGIAGGAGIGGEAYIDGRFGTIKAIGGVDSRLGQKIDGIGSMLPKLPGLRSSVDGELGMSEEFGRGVAAGPGGRGYMEAGTYIGGVANIARPGIAQSTGREGTLYITTMGRDKHTSTEANNPKVSYMYPREGGISSFSTRYDINSGTGTVEGAGIGGVAGNNRGINISQGSGFRGGVSAYGGTGIGEGADMGAIASNNRGTGISEGLGFRGGVSTYGGTGVAEVAGIGAVAGNGKETGLKGGINTYRGAGIENSASTDGRVNKIGGGSGITEITNMKGATRAGMNVGTAIGGESGIAGPLGIETGYTTSLGGEVLKGSEANMGRQTYTYTREASINGFGAGTGLNAIVGNSEGEIISVRSDIAGGAGIDAKASGGAAIGGGATVGGGAVVSGGTGRDRGSYTTTLDGMIHTDSERNMGRGTYAYTREAGTNSIGAGSVVNSKSVNRETKNISVGSGVGGEVNNYGGAGIAGEAGIDARVIYTGGVGGGRGSSVIDAAYMRDATSAGIGVGNVAGGGIAIGGGAVVGGGMETERGLYTKTLTGGVHTGTEGNMGRETYTYRREPSINGFGAGSSIGTLSGNGQRESISVGSGIGGGVGTHDGASIGGGTVIDGRASSTGVVGGGSKSSVIGTTYMRGATKLGIGIGDAVGEGTVIGGAKGNFGTERIEGESYTTTMGERLYSGTEANMGRGTYTYMRQAGISGTGTGVGIGEGANIAEGASIGAGTSGGASNSGSRIEGRISSHREAVINGGTDMGGAAGIGEAAYMRGATKTENYVGTTVGDEAAISGGVDFRGSERIKGSSYTTTMGGVYSDADANIRKSKYIQGTGFGTGVDFGGGTSIRRGIEVDRVTSINGGSGIGSGAGEREKGSYTTSMDGGMHTNTDVNMEKGTYIYTRGAGLGAGNDINREIGIRRDATVYRGLGIGVGAGNGGEANMRRTTYMVTSPNQGGQAYMAPGNGIGGGYTRRDIEIRDRLRPGDGTGVGLRANNDFLLKGYNNYRQAYTIVPL